MFPVQKVRRNDGRAQRSHRAAFCPRRRADNPLFELFTDLERIKNGISGRRRIDRPRGIRARGTHTPDPLRIWKVLRKKTLHVSKKTTGPHRKEGGRFRPDRMPGQRPAPRRALLAGEQTRMTSGRFLMSTVSFATFE